MIDDNIARKALRVEADDDDLVFDKNQHTYEVFKFPPVDKGDKHTIKRASGAVPPPPLVASVVMPPLAQSPLPADVQDVQMDPAELAVTQDIPPPRTPPPSSVPAVNVTSPLSPPRAPPVETPPPLFSDIGDQGATDMDLDTDTTSAEGLPHQMEKLNTAGTFIFLIILLFLTYSLHLAAASDTDEVPPLLVNKGMYLLACFYPSFCLHVFRRA